MALIGIALWALIPGFIAKGKGRSFWAYYFLSFLITPLITMIITACLKRIEPVEDHDPLSDTVVDVTRDDLAVEQQNHSQQSVNITNSLSNNDPAAVSKEQKVRFCRECGFELLEGSEFCSRCGTPINR